MAAAAETLKTKAEQYTAAGNQVFKDAVEKSLTALNEVNAQSKQNLEAVVASVTAATKGAEALGAHAIAYSKKTLQDQVDAARSLTAARSVQEAVELQSAWAKTALEAYLAEVTKASEIVSAALKETITPLNARVTAAVEKFQAAR
jgi:phasin family protein